MPQKYKKRLIFDKLLKLRNDRSSRSLRYISYSIPLACIMALIFGMIYGIIFVNDNKSEKVFAADIPSSTASMSIESPTLSSNSIVPNSIAYLSTNVTINAQYIQSYNLTISGNPNLSGPTTITGTSTSTTPANMTNNTWGYNWGATNTTESTLNYSSLSTTAATLALDPLSNGAANFTKKLTFAVKFGSAETGHYTNDITLSFTANPKTLIGYSVTYDANGGIGGPSNYSEFSYDTGRNYIIPLTQPTRSNYVFLGWSTNPDAINVDANYVPGKTVTLTQSNPMRNLYAIWAPTWYTMTTMQQMSPDICGDAPTGWPKTLTDIRDGSTYTVAKLIDGKCWMTQNLRLSSDTMEVESNRWLQPSSTNIATPYQLPASTNNFEGGYNSTVQQIRSSTDDDYGAYYSWCAATAGTCSTITTSNLNTQYDICPRGWRLPIDDGTNGEFKTLYTAYPNNSYTIYSTVDGKDGYWLGSSSTNTGGAFFYMAGYFAGSNVVAEGSRGTYWSSTTRSTDISSVVVLDFVTNKTYGEWMIQYPYYMGYGYGVSVRCVAK